MDVAAEQEDAGSRRTGTQSRRIGGRAVPLICDSRDLTLHIGQTVAWTVG